jgi:hypothetical protein
MGLTVSSKGTLRTYNKQKPLIMYAPKAKIMRNKKKKIKTKPSGGGW